MKSIKKVLLLIFVFAFSIIFSPILNAKSVNSTENNQKSTTEQTVVTSENSANAVQDEGFDVKENLIKFAKNSGIYALFTTHWKALIMIVISCILLYLAIVKQYEPLLLFLLHLGCCYLICQVARCIIPNCLLTAKFIGLTFSKQLV